MLTENYAIERVKRNFENSSQIYASNLILQTPSTTGYVYREHRQRQLYILLAAENITGREPYPTRNPCHPSWIGPCVMCTGDGALCTQTETALLVADNIISHTDLGESSQGHMSTS